MDIIFIVLALVMLSLVNAAIFYILVGRQIPLKEAYKLTTTATTLNKLLFTGSGFLASSYLSRNKNLSSYKALSAFFVLESLLVLPWLIMGIYFGARLAVKLPLLLAVILVVLAAAGWLKRNKLAPFLKKMLESLGEVRGRIFLALPLALLNTGFLILYYFFLFEIFDFAPGLIGIIKIVAASLTLGYLSPAPAGLGFKETGMVLLLKEGGLPLGTAVSLALWDRVAVTAFWGILGSLVGFDLIKEEFSKRFKRRDRIE